MHVTEREVFHESLSYGQPQKFVHAPLVLRIHNAQTEMSHTATILDYIRNVCFAITKLHVKPFPILMILEY